MKERMRNRHAPTMPGNDQGIRLGETQEGIQEGELGTVRFCFTNNLETISISTAEIEALALFRAYAATTKVLLVHFSGGWAIVGGAC